MMANTVQDNSMWVLLPVKQFSRAKQRLSPWLRQHSHIQNAELARAMLTDVLSALKQSQIVSHIAVVSAEPELSHLLADDVLLIRESEHVAGTETGNHQGLNGALTEALNVLQQRGVQHCAILPGDIPLMEPAQLDDCLTRYLKHCVDQGPDGIAVVPSQDQDGTNLLCVNPQSPIVLQYGSNSYQRHLQSAAIAGKQALTLSAASIAKDIDTTLDLHDLLGYCEKPGADLAPATCQLLGFNSYSIQMASAFL